MNQRRVLLAAVLAAFVPSPLRAQGQPGTVPETRREDLLFYHGAAGASSLVRYGDNRPYVRDARREVGLRLPTGSQVCLTVVNAHPADYLYSLAVTVDTTTPRLPQLPMLPVKFDSMLPPRTVDRERLGAYELLLSTIRYLSEDLRSARSAAARSDVAEPIGDVDAEPPAVGYRWMQNFLRDSLPGAPGRFNDGQLMATLARFVQNARTELGSDSLHGIAVTAIEAWIPYLVSSRDELRAAFAPGGRLTLCGTVGAGATSMALTIKAKDAGFARGRSVGDDARVTIVVRPPYHRDIVSIHPVAFLALASNVPDFQVVNDTLRQTAGTGTGFRVGTFLNLNVANFGPDEQIGAGLGLGLGITSDSKVLNDIFVGGVVSYRDAVRVGLGIGASRFASSVKGAAVGQPFPANSGNLADLIESRYSTAFHLIFVFPGFGL